MSPRTPRHRPHRSDIHTQETRVVERDKGKKEDDTNKPRIHDSTHPPGQVSLARQLAEAGLETRRKVALLLESGRLLVNGHTALPGERIAEITSLRLDGKEIPIPSFDNSPLRVIAYHKAVCELCSLHDPRGRPLIYRRLPSIKGRRWIHVGRLDYMTEGLLLFTNSGDLAYRLMHPSYQLERVYVVRVYGKPVDDDLVQNLLNGVLLDDGPAHFTRIERMRKKGASKNTWLRVTLIEGRNREVRRLFQAVGLKINHLIRIQYGPYRLSLQSRPGNWHELTQSEKQQLTDCTGITTPDTTP